MLAVRGRKLIAFENPQEVEGTIGAREREREKKHLLLEVIKTDEPDFRLEM